MGRSERMLGTVSRRLTARALLLCLVLGRVGANPAAAQPHDAAAQAHDAAAQAHDAAAQAHDAAARGHNAAAQALDAAAIEAALVRGDRAELEALRARLGGPSGPTAEAHRASVDQALSLLARDEQPSRALLKIQNHTPYRVYIFVDGALTGWVGPYATYVLRGFVKSYYTLYSRTYYGTRYWGPRTMHLSGIYHLW